MKLDCKLLEDLLPLYVEQLTNQQSNQWIEEHLEGCQQCRVLLQQFQQELLFNEGRRDTIKESDPVDKLAAKMMATIKRRLIAISSLLCLGALLLGIFSDVYVFSFLALVMLATAILVFVGQTTGGARKYWVGGTCIYIFSALAGFSIGLFTLVMSFVLFALAIGHTLDKLHSWWNRVGFVLAGVLSWLIVINVYYGFWIFYPVVLVLEKLFG